MKTQNYQIKTDMKVTMYVGNHSDTNIGIDLTGTQEDLEFFVEATSSEEAYRKCEQMYEKALMSETGSTNVFKCNTFNEDLVSVSDKVA